MKTELIKALKETILDLKLDRKNYNWRSADDCNCGILAQNICGMDDKTLNQNRSYGLWSAVCQRTNEKISVVMEKLFSVGLVRNDIIHLENLTDTEILKEARLENTSILVYLDDGIMANSLRSEKDAVIKYMEAWIRILEREEVVPEIAPINAAPNKPMEFISYEEMKTEMELLFQN